MSDMLFEAFGYCPETQNEINSISCQQRDICKAPMRFLTTAIDEQTALTDIHRQAQMYKCKSNKVYAFYRAEQAGNL